MFFHRRKSRLLGIVIVFVIIVLTVKYTAWDIIFISRPKSRQLGSLVNSGNLPDVVVPGSPLNDIRCKNVVKEIPNMAEVNRDQVFFPEDRQLSGYIVYDCSTRHYGLCGGWSDRISGILSTFGLAIISRRHFRIRHNKPCSFDKLLEPNRYKWTLDESKIPTNSEYMYLIDNNSLKLRTKALESKHLENAFKSNVTFIRMNWDITLDFRRRHNISEDFPWVTKLHYADIYYGLYHYLFKPGETVLSEFANLQKKRKHGLLACSHSRAGDPGVKRRDFSDIWKFLSKLDRTKYDIFIASDQQYVRDDGIRFLQGFDVITSTGVLGHMDLGNSACEVFKSSMVDFYTLTTCDLLVITDSGFSILAAYVRGTSDHLYCMGIQGGVFPCSRNVLEDIYPGNMLAPRMK